ncbi:MAG: NfeD family protein [Halothiobacillaceae bacterium]|jgi:membrane protein implicated in regulation of membrane protease activity|nr:NfeD family protein [Halothiobacillaceae bacterium]
MSEADLWSWSYWGWFVIGVLLIALEIFAPSTLFLWLGLAALIMGGVGWLFPDLGWPYQLLLYSALAVTMVLAGRRYVKRHPIPTDHPTLNRRGEQYIGRVFTLASAIVNGVGKLKVDDTSWKIVGPNLPAGTPVEVIGVEGTSLRVRRHDTPSVTGGDSDA